MGLAYIYDLVLHIIALTVVETANWRGATSQRRSDIAACAIVKTFLVELSGLLVQVSKVCAIYAESLLDECEMLIVSGLS